MKRLSPSVSTRHLRTALSMLLLWGGILAGCAHIPLTHYYTFDPDRVAAPETTAGDPAPVVLAIGAFEARIPYQHDRLVFRTSPYEVGFYEYHKWLRPLPELVHTQVVRQGRASGLFSRVHGQAFQMEADYILTGTLTMFDRWDRASSSEARVEIAYQLLDAYGERILWADSIATSAPVATLEDAVTTVQSFETALHVNIQHALEHVRHEVSRQP